MAVHAVRMVNTNLDSVQVVIKPGAGLQLSLEMRQRGHSGESVDQMIFQNPAKFLGQSGKFDFTK